MSNPLTLQFAGRVLEIATEAKISKAYDAARMPGIPHPPYEPCKAVWDTGAMSTVIPPGKFRGFGPLATAKSVR